jgi:chloride channel protein, CIC family
VLAPLLMMGGALGGLEAMFLPFEGAGFWPLVSMGAILGGTMRSPFTGIIFALELTHDINMMVPLLLAVMIAHGFTVLALRRSILTEKVARRGYHLSREYAVDPLEILFVREVMRTNTVAIAADTPLETLRQALNQGPDRRPQRLYPVTDQGGALAGVVTRNELQAIVERGAATSIGTAVKETARKATVAYPDEPLRVVVYRMAGTGLTRFPVVERGLGGRLVGMIALTDLLFARTKNLEAEERRERVFALPRPFASSRS